MTKLRLKRNWESRSHKPRPKIHALPVLDGRAPSVSRCRAADSREWQRWRAEKVAPFSRHCRRRPLDAGSEKKQPVAAWWNRSRPPRGPGATKTLRGAPNARVGSSQAGHVDRGAESGPKQSIPATSGYTLVMRSLADGLRVPGSTRFLGFRWALGSGEVSVRYSVSGVATELVHRAAS